MDVASIQQMSLSKLEARLVEIDEGLAALSHFTLNTGVGAIGYRSQPVDEADLTDRPEWIHVDLEKSYWIDQIVLVPTVWRDLERGYVADGFPVAFRILAGGEGDSEGSVLAEYDIGDARLKSVAPVVLAVDPVEVSWIRLEVTRLSPRARDGKYILQLAEIMVFQGPDNHALRKPVSTSGKESVTTAWKAPWLVDGNLPYVMNSSHGEISLPMVSGVDVGERAVMTIDLGRRQPLERLRLYTVEQGDTIPHAYSGEFGIPGYFRIEGALNEDFSDAFVLLEVNFDGILQTAPIMEWAFPEASARYVRMVAEDLYIYQADHVTGTRIGFAEIELLNDSGNVALGKKVTASFRMLSGSASAAALTDGHNLYGRILQPRDWMAELAQRRDLEEERPVVVAEISQRFTRQKKNFRLLIWIALALAASVAFTIFYFRIARQRQEALIRERIAANLHDELGANLHAIGLLGDLAKEAVDSKEDLVDTVDRIRALTMRTGQAASNCANLLEAQGFCEDLVSEMKQDTAHLLGDLDCRFDVSGEAILNELPRRTRLDLYLFYKEALTNIIRHSGATKVESELIADAKSIHLTVIDNGHGLSHDSPKALARRARLLRAEFTVGVPKLGKGTQIDLIVKQRKLRFF